MTFIDTQESLVSLSRQFILMSVLAPTGELLSFASSRQLLHALLYLLHPCSRKESSQRKGDPDSAKLTRHLHVPRPSGAMHANQLSCRFVLRFSLLARVFEGPSLALRKRAASLPPPFGPCSPKAAMLGAE